MSHSSRYRKPLLITLACHLALMLLLVISITATQFRAPPSAAQMTTIKATTVTQAQLDTAAKITKPEHEKVLQAQAVVLKKQQAARAKAEAIEREQAKAKQQAKVLAEAKAKQQAKASADAKAKAKAQAQAQAKAQTQAKMLAQQKAMQALQKKLLQQQIASEQKNISQILSTAQTGVIDQYKAQILSVVQSNWRIDKVDEKLKCIYSVTLAPDGTVISENLVRSSGDDNLDQSARQAIQVSSPLPVPSDPALFDHFRHLLLTLSPQGYLQVIEQ